jgi:ribosomal protein S18 acetylase RimI-like enzyme
MKQERFIIFSDKYPHIRLRSISNGDLDQMMRWKNINKASFFHQEDISIEQQLKWYQGFCERDFDYMFIVEEIGEHYCQSVGCVGFRLLSDTADIYNIMRGQSGQNKEAKIGDAIVLMCSYINTISDLKISCKVISSNPAMDWYKSLGFVIRDEQDNYFNVDLDYSRFNFCQIKQKSV